MRRTFPWILIVALLPSVAGGIAGCSTPEPATATALFRDPSEPTYRQVLTASDDRHIEAGLATAAADHSAVESPQQAGPRGRWTDVRSAVVFACDDIEAAVVRESEQLWGWEFGIRTAEDWPGTLIVRRTNGDRVYEATATIGWMNDLSERAAALLKALDHQMQAFGKKRKMPD